MLWSLSKRLANLFVWGFFLMSLYNASQLYRGIMVRRILIKREEPKAFQLQLNPELPKRLVLMRKVAEISNKEITELAFTIPDNGSSEPVRFYLTDTQKNEYHFKCPVQTKVQTTSGMVLVQPKTATAIAQVIH